MMLNFVHFLSCDDGSIPPSVLKDIDRLLWDQRVVTIDDIQRWLSQGIHTAASSFNNTSNASSNFASDEMGDSIHQWGLVQDHGGPCGVLAAIQSELLALILFGHDLPCDRLYNKVFPHIKRTNDISSTTTTSYHDTQSNKSISIETSTTSITTEIRNRNETTAPLLRIFPDSLFNDDDNDLQQQRIPMIDSSLIHRSMATALGWILARAAMASTSAEDDIETIFQQANVKLVLPSSFCMNVKENPVRSLQASSTEKLSFLRCITLMLAQKDTVLSHSNSHIHSPLMDSLFATLRWSSPDDFRLHIMSLLAYCVADYLQFSKALYQFFNADGGVIRFTQSLILTRGIVRMQQDMDDPLSTHLTSQFGQCSQELINLTLTGQAVSNVFDNTLILHDGSVQCRGISSQVHIGYLTHLEALRYCQVGSYFKSPKFPIWMIGSQSHFSVLFSTSYDPLKEDPTQVLLNNCRRAFASIPSAEESGFIASTSLGDVLDAIRETEFCSDTHNLKMNWLHQINQCQIDKLVAHLEIPDSGIIIWDDFWRTISRLMTGVSLTHILGEVTIQDADSAIAHCDVNPDRRTTLTLSNTGEVYSCPIHDKTDEEIARELQSLYDQEMNNTSAIAIEQPVSSSIQQSPKGPSTGDKFRLYYYNGLRGGTLSSFFVSPSKSDEAISENVTLTSSSSPSLTYLEHHSPTSNNILENIIKTKWQSCKIDLCGIEPPNVD